VKKDQFSEGSKKKNCLTTQTHFYFEDGQNSLLWTTTKKTVHRSNRAGSLMPQFSTQQVSWLLGMHAAEHCKCLKVNSLLRQNLNVIFWNYTQQQRNLKST